MKPRRIVLAAFALAGLLCLAAAPPARLTDEQRSWLKERDQEVRQANLRLAKSDFAGAVKHGNAALRLTRLARGPSHVEVANLLVVLADWCELADKIEEALEHRKAALPLWEAIAGKDHWQTAGAREALRQTRRMAFLGAEGRAEVVAALRQEGNARSLLGAGKPEEAERVLREGLKAFRERLGEESLLVGRTFDVVGMARYNRQDKRGARTAWWEAAAIGRKVFPKGHPNVAQSLNNLGVVQQDLRDYEGARKSYEEALAIRRKALPEGHPHIADSLTGLGAVQRHLRDYEGARKSLKEALAIRRKALPEGDPHIADSLSHLGAVQRDLRDYKGGKKSHEEALAIRRKALPEEHSHIAQSLYNLGSAQLALREYEGARKSLEEALRIFRKALPEGDPLIAHSLTILGKVQDDLREYEGAKKSHEEALRIIRKALPEGDPLIAHSLTNLGNVQHDLMEYEGARKSHEEALAIRRKAHPKGHPDIAQSLNNLGVVQRDLREYEGARKSHEEALAIRRKALPKGHPDIAQSLTNLGNVQHDLREYEGARKSLEEALASQRAAHPKGHPDIAQSLNNLGVVQRALREYEGARKSHEEALAIRRKALPKGHPDIAQSLNNLGVVQHALREYEGARKSHEEALAIGRKALPEGHPHIADSLTGLGAVQRDLRDYEGARKSYEEGLAIRRKALPEGDPRIAESLNNLGVVQYDLRDYEGARKSLEEAFRIDRKALPEGHPDIAASLNNLGLVQGDLKDYEGARKSHEVALRIYRKALPEGDPLIADSLNNVGAVQYDLRDYEGARKSHEEALSIRRAALPKGHPHIADSLHNLAALAASSGEGGRKALSGLKEAVEIRRRDLGRLALVQAETEQLLAATEARSSLDLFLSLAVGAEREHAEEAHALPLAVKGAVTARQRWARQTRDVKDAKTLSLLALLKKANLDVLRLSFSEERDAKTREKEAEALRDAGERRDRLEQDLAAFSPAFKRLLDSDPVGPEQVRAALPADVVLIDFLDYRHLSPPPKGKTNFLVENRTVAFVLRPGKDKVALVQLGRTEALAKLVGEWRSSHGAGKAPPKGSPDPASDLREKLWLPLEKHLGSAKVVLYSPDGSLNGLPLAALPGAEKGKFLLHERAFAVVPVPALLPELLAAKHAREKGEPSLLLVGGIDFGDGERPAPKGGARLPGLPKFGKLPGTESEVNDLRAQFEDAFADAPAPKVLRKGKATKAAFLEEAPKADFIHLATHGFFAPESEVSALDGSRRSGLFVGIGREKRPAGRHPGLLSGVVFAGANDPKKAPEDVLLTALEASELRLDKARLVALSACDTGRGLVAAGEGVLGLQRAFQLAGARSVVASLWRVPDAQTHQLMREFYRRVWSEKAPSKAEALRQAQLWMLENHKRGGLELKTDKSSPVSPYFWAAFVLSGDWR